MSEKELIDQLKKGDYSALEGIMGLYQDYVYTIALQMIKKKESAEEITQDVFVRVFKKISSYEERSKFSTWLFTIVYRISLNYISKKNILVPDSDLQSRETNWENSKINEYESKADKHMWDELHSETEYGNDKQEIIWDAINQLNVQQGVIVSLFYLQQFSVNEVAEIIQLPINTIKTQLFRGRNNLKKVLLKNYTPEDLL